MKQKKIHKVVIGGGGTGGHIFPAISIANEIKKRDSEAEILFVGALKRMEMEKVPLAGYRIEGLPVMGFNRKNILKNIKVIYCLIKSMHKAKKILNQFKPNIAVGVGGYASGPVMRQAAKKGIPIIIQEQNSYAGITNRLLAKKASKICVAYDNMEKYFPKNKMVITGNPVRKDVFISLDKKRKQAQKYFGLKDKEPVVLIIGGSLGSMSFNNAIIKNLDSLSKANFQLLWQSGKIYYKNALQHLEPVNAANIKLVEFVEKMDYAYAVADIIVSRAGAGTISELCLVGKPVILIPSPNVAEDHQTKNAMALVQKNAAEMIKDANVENNLFKTIKSLLKNKNRKKELADNIKKLGIDNSAEKIVDEIENFI